MRLVSDPVSTGIIYKVVLGMILGLPWLLVAVMVIGAGVYLIRDIQNTKGEKMKNEKGIVLVLSLLVMTVLSILGLSFLSIALLEHNMSTNYKLHVQAFYAADGGVEHAKVRLPDTTSFTGTFGNGATYSVDVVSIGNGRFVATSAGKSRLGKATIKATFESTIPPGLKGAVSTNGPTMTTGSMVVDGRDHDVEGDLTGGSGTYGIYTSSTFAHEGASKVGGLGYAPDFSGLADPSTIVEGATDVATTPDEVLGYNEGDLKAMAMSGANGSQYVTDPAMLNVPLSGVTFVELPPGGVWDDANLGDATGILVVHNATGDATVSNTTSSGPSCGCFSGLLIVDNIVHIHSTIIGALVSLTATPSGNVLGNGDGEVLYSSAAINQAMGGGESVRLVSWTEVR